MPFVSAGGVRVHYAEHGPPREQQPPTAVLLHGHPPDHRLMKGCFEPVFAVRPAWRRLYLDLPGMGRTRSAEHIDGGDALLTVVQESVDTLVGEQTYVLCGESYGAHLARGLAAAAPHRVGGMALVCPVVEVDPGRRDLPEHTVLAIDRELPPEILADSRFTGFAVVQTAETYRRTSSEVFSGVSVADREALRRLRTDWSGTFRLEKGGPPFDRPVLFVTGRQDSVTGYRDAWTLLEHYPRATFAVLDRAGHNLQIEQPALFGALVHEWLDRVEERLSS